MNDKANEEREEVEYAGGLLKGGPKISTTFGGLRKEAIVKSSDRKRRTIQSGASMLKASLRLPLRKSSKVATVQNDCERAASSRSSRSDCSEQTTRDLSLKLPDNASLINGGMQQCIAFRPVESLEATDEHGKDRMQSSSTPNHVSSCTCPQCRKARRLSENAPIKLRYKAGIRLIESTFERNGFIKTTKDDWNVLWVSGSLKPHVYQILRRHQKVNQFPKTYEITRKDQLCRNMTRMQQLYGLKHFDFIPKTYVLPEDRSTFEDEVRRELLERASDGTGTKKKLDDDLKLWIVKPAASACGRGIFVTDNIAEIPIGGSEESNVIVSRYIANPLLLDGRKFDLRIYVAVTSFSPLRIYIYEEGLVRLTTMPYSKDVGSLKNRLVHLTNYSVQKKSVDYVQNNNNQGEDLGDEQISNKWSLKTFRARLSKMGYDHEKIFRQIETVIIKTLISIEPQVSRAVEMHQRIPRSSFQLFGFDILLDESLKPWLLEVNLGPSLSCDASLDLHIKGEMIADLLTLAGVRPVDIQKQKSKEEFSKGFGVSRLGRSSMLSKHGDISSRGSTDESDVRKCILQMKEEAKRSGNWKPIYPTANAFIFDRFFENKGLNQAIVQHLSSGKTESDKNRITKQLSRARTTEGISFTS